MRPASAHPAAARGFSLIELMIVIGIVVVLAGLAFPIASLIRNRANATAARQLVSQLVMALDTYASQDRRHRYPLHDQLFPVPSLPLPHALSMVPVDGASIGVLALLIDAGLAPNGGRANDDHGRMVDPWGSPYRYQLTRPIPTVPVGALLDWNWDAAASRAKAWDDRGDRAAPYPYVWSLGKDGSATDAGGWIYDAQR